MSKRTNVSPEMVGLYVLGLLTPAARKRVERSFVIDLQVQSWFMDFDALPDNVLNDDDPHVKGSVAEIRGSMVRRGLLPADARSETKSGNAFVLALADYQRLSTSDRRNASLGERFNDFDVQPYGGCRKQLDFPRALAGKPVSLPPPTNIPDYISRDGDTIQLKCIEDMIPHGLGWLILTEFDGVVTLHLPRLEYDSRSKVWWCKVPVRRILGGRYPNERKVTVTFVPAMDENAQSFDGREVREFVAKLPLRSEQRSRAERFINSRE